MADERVGDECQVVMVASSRARTPFAYNTLDCSQAAIHMVDSSSRIVESAAHLHERGLHTCHSSKDLVGILDGGTVDTMLHLVDRSVDAVPSDIVFGLRRILRPVVVHVELSGVV
jgi:hypothetical protein